MDNHSSVENDRELRILNAGLCFASIHAAFKPCWLATSRTVRQLSAPVRPAVRTDQARRDVRTRLAACPSQ